MAKQEDRILKCKTNLCKISKAAICSCAMAIIFGILIVIMNIGVTILHSIFGMSIFKMLKEWSW